ncbi:hypothetical protein JS562_54315, partial [Agrobacterium sp. S2]|nr:hypothetical protein [Agrobacterium sp. S2]
MNRRLSLLQGARFRKRILTTKVSRRFAQKALSRSKIAPASVERGIRVLSQLFALAETQVHSPKATEDGLMLIVENESIAFGLEEQPEKTLHQRTTAELKRRDERAAGATPPIRGQSTTNFHPAGSLS